MAALLVALAVMLVVLTVAMPAWNSVVQREREEELVFRGRQYARAVGLFQRRFAGAFPPSLDFLVEQKFLRRKFRDPMAPDGTFQLIYQNTPLSFSDIGPSASPAAARGGTPAGRGALAPGRAAAAGLARNSFGLAGPFGGTLALPAGGRAAGALGGIIGVVSTSTKESFRRVDGHSRYNEWLFVWLAASQPGRGGGPGTGSGTGPGAGGPGGRGGGGPGAPGRGPGNPGRGRSQ